MPASPHGTGKVYIRGAQPVDGVYTSVSIQPQGDDTSAIIVKSPSSTWGEDGETAGSGDPLYSTGQFIQFEKEGVGTTSDNTLFRVDRTGGLGMGGSMHIATGLRQRGGYAPSQAVWIDPSVNTIPLLIHNPTVADSATWDKDFISIIDTRSANTQVFRVTSAGAVHTNQDLVARVGAATQVTIGNLFTVAGVGLGSANDTTLLRLSAGDLLVGNRFTFPETTDPSAPTANRGTLYVRDNGSGKSQLCIRFNTGAIQVIATEP